MSDLAEFLKARLDEDERVAKRAYGRSWDADDVVEDGAIWVLSEDMHLGQMEPASAPHIARHDPARVLAEIEAKRQLLKSHRDYEGVCPRCFDWQNKPVQREVFPCEVVRLLALPYAAHPDYDEAWRP